MRKTTVSRSVVVQGHADLVEIVSARNAARGFAGLLNGRQEKRDEHSQNAGYDQQFDNCECDASRAHSMRRELLDSFTAHDPVTRLSSKCARELVLQGRCSYHSIHTAFTPYHPLYYVPAAITGPQSNLTAIRNADLSHFVAET